MRSGDINEKINYLFRKFFTSNYRNVFSSYYDLNNFFEEITINLDSKENDQEIFDDHSILSEVDSKMKSLEGHIKESLDKLGEIQECINNYINVSTIYDENKIDSYFMQINTTRQKIFELKNEVQNKYMQFLYHLSSKMPNYLNDLAKKTEDRIEEIEHKVTGHAMTLMGVLAAIITLIVTLTVTSIQVMKGLSFYEQLLTILGIGIVIVVSMIFLLLISAYFFAAKDRKVTAAKGLSLSTKVAAVILYMGLILLCSFFFVEKLYSNVNYFYKNSLGFKILIALFMLVMLSSIFCFIWFVKEFTFSKTNITKTIKRNGKKRDVRVAVHLAKKRSIIAFLINVIILFSLCYLFFVSYYAPSREISERHSQEIKILITEYKIEEIDDVPTNILFNYEGIQYIIAYDARLFHNGNLYFCEEHKTLE